MTAFNYTLTVRVHRTIM